MVGVGWGGVFSSLEEEMPLAYSSHWFIYVTMAMHSLGPCVSCSACDVLLPHMGMAVWEAGVALHGLRTPPYPLLSLESSLHHISILQVEILSPFLSLNTHAAMV